MNSSTTNTNPKPAQTFWVTLREHHRTRTVTVTGRGWSEMDRIEQACIRASRMTAGFERIARVEAVQP